MGSRTEYIGTTAASQRRRREAKLLEGEAERPGWQGADAEAAKPPHRRRHGGHAMAINARGEQHFNWSSLRYTRSGPVLTMVSSLYFATNF